MYKLISQESRRAKIPFLPLPKHGQQVAAANSLAVIKFEAAIFKLFFPRTTFTIERT